MMFLIINAVLSAIFFLIVVLPPVYIYNPDRYPGESNGPPKAGEVIPDEDVTHAVKQKLYLLFIIPTCAAVNALFLYFAYYRPIRFIHYRVELNLLTLRLTLDAGRQQLQKSGVLGFNNRSMIGGPSMMGSGPSFIGFNNSIVSPSPRYPKSAGRSFRFDGNERSRQKLATSVNWEWRRHARPKSVKKDAWVNSAVFAEISVLRDEVEQRFLVDGSVADANFAKAVVKTAGAFVPTAAPTSVGVGQPRRPSRTEAPGGDFYMSSRPPLMSLGPRASLTSHNGGSGVHARMSGGPAAGSEHDEVKPERANSVLLVPTESTHRRGSASTAPGGSGAGSGGGSGPSALRFFRGNHHHSNSSPGGDGDATKVFSPEGDEGLVHNGTSNRAERRENHEPAEAGDDGDSPREPAGGETAARGGGGGGGGEGGGSASKPSMWGRLWRRNESKEA